MNACVNETAIKGFASGNLNIFEKAFKDCGIGGQFSKFKLLQTGNWFELETWGASVGNKYVYRVHDKVKRSAYEEISSMAARRLHDNAEWHTHLHTAQKILGKIVTDPKQRELNKYYHDAVHGSVYVTNRMYILEIGPLRRIAPTLSSNAVFTFLNKDESFNCDDVTQYQVQAFTELDNVVIVTKDLVSGGSITFHKDETIEEFEAKYGA